MGMGTIHIHASSESAAVMSIYQVQCLAVIKTQYLGEHAHFHSFSGLMLKLRELAC